MAAPVIGITADADERTYRCARAYSTMVAEAGGIPIILPHRAERINDYIQICDGLVLSGGDDPRMEEFGVATHPKATPVDSQRQAFEVALLRAAPSDQPVLGVCLGMQLMALVAGGRLDQHLPDTLASHDQHWGQKRHAVAGSIGRGEILSHHRQGVSDPGRLVVTARAPDGLIEAVADPACRWRVGVQWHPERSGEGPLGRGLFVLLIDSCRAAATR